MKEVEVSAGVRSQKTRDASASVEAWAAEVSCL